MRRNFLLALFLALWAGCATPPPAPPAAPRVAAPPANALLTQRAVLTVRGRQFALNGYLSINDQGAMRLIVTEGFGRILADVLVTPEGAVDVIRAGPVFRRAWIQNYLAADLLCIFGRAPRTPCPVTTLGPDHFQIVRHGYKLDLRTVETRPGPQPPDLFVAPPAARP